ncbi:hypothetical protein [Nonomuraea jabiensis]|uniref:Uncharacterized protein n=1 Tax=Nonomuraea jabiensis TaxID=882448 RepID=A0A7W9G3K5_9ACTN|nr:hypothetical protein [Nonomuraea jabiensis]MBB5776514.1 hypothetical protein [Nonomuraea jabiensis]
MRFGLGEDESGVDPCLALGQAFLLLLSMGGPSPLIPNAVIVQADD